MQLINAYLAAHDSRGVEKFARSDGREELVSVFKNPLLVSRYRAAKEHKVAVTQSLPQLDSNGDIVVSGEKLGHVETNFLRPLPIEPRLRVAYQIMYEEFVKYLFRQGFPMLAFDGHQLTIFVPDSQSFDKDIVWKNFVNFTLGENIELIERNYYALAALHQLGMGPPWQPIFNRNHAQILTGFCRTAWSRSTEWRPKIDNKLKELKETDSIHRLDKVFKGKPRAAGQFGFFQRADEVGKYVSEELLPKLETGASFELVPLPFIGEPGYLGVGTDLVQGRGKTERFCYGCSRTLTDPETFTSSKLRTPDMV